MFKLVFPFLEQVPGDAFHRIDPLTDLVRLSSTFLILGIQTVIDFFQITAIKIDGNTVAVTDSSGTTQTITVQPGQTVGIIARNGQTLYVADTGTQQVYTTPNPPRKGANNNVGTAAQTGRYGSTVSFVPAPIQRYGFDAIGNGKNKPDSYF